MFVYVIVNSETLKIYIGQHKGNNLQKYLQTKISDAAHQVHLRSWLYASMRKHPKTAWSIHPLVSALQTRAECDYWEKLLIKVLNTQHSDVGYNICRGGEGFTGPCSEETKQKISKRLKGHPVSEETRNKMRVASFGKTESAEVKAKISAAQKGNSNACGAVRSPEYRAKMSASKKGQPSYERTPEWRAQQSAARIGKPNRWWLGRKHSEASLIKMQRSAKLREANKRLNSGV
jgi:hypothetical protein